MKYGMIVNYGYCSGCRSCEVSCRKEKGLSLEEWGIKVNDMGLEKQGGAWEWDYLPAPSGLCDMCEGRIEDGKKPLCQLHCLANVIEVVPVGEIGAKLAETSAKFGKTVAYVR